MSSSSNPASKRSKKTANKPIETSDTSVKSLEDQAETLVATPPKPTPGESQVVTPEPDLIADSVANYDPEELVDPLSGLEAISRQQPIPPPSEERQYRAIGLIRGKYLPSMDQFTQGVLLSSDGTPIDAVLLGRIMSLVKNHLNLDQEHLWVVYPRTRQQDSNLHAQIVGVWEPETLSSKPNESGSNDEQDTSTVKTDYGDVEDGYFSVRGEVIYQSLDPANVIVKIKQSPRKPTDNPKFFKLKLNGILEGKAVGHFWDLHVRRQQNSLTIEQAKDIGLLPPKKNPKKAFGKGGNKRFGGGGKKPFDPNRSSRFKDSAATTVTPPVRKDPLPKPVKRNDRSSQPPVNPD